VAARSGQGSIAGRGLFKAAARVGIGLVLAALVYVGLVQAEVLRSPLDPRIAGDIALARGDRAGLRVLFVGNSFTYDHSMPELVQELAAGDAGAPPIFVVQYAAPGWTLEDAARDDGLADLLDEARWDVVVLQEQSQLLSFPPEQRRRETYPFARSLRREIVLAGGRPLLFMTWGYKEGDPRNYPADSFTAMQARLADGYFDLGEELSATVAPVGLAWAKALQHERELDLWASDGRHPSASGSYLAACVFYTLLSGRDPAGSDFTAGLETAEAKLLQHVASAAVHGDAGDLRAA
jgi:hypothetical protein